MSSIFFSVVNDESPCIENTNDKSFNEIPFSSYLYGEEAINMEMEYSNIILNNLRATYNALKEGTVVKEIVYEGFIDAVKSIVEWFREWLRKFLEFVSKAFKKLYKWTLDCDREVKTFFSDTQVEFEPFIVSGYKYTLNAKNVDSSILEDVVNKTEKYVNDVLMNRESNNLAAVVSLACNAIGGDNVLADYRARIVGLNVDISEGNYGLELFKLFRGGMEDPGDVIIDKASLKDMKKLIEKLKIAVDTCKNDRNRMKDQVETIIKFIESQPVKVGKEDELRLDSDIRYRTRNFDVVTSRREEYTDREIYKALTTIYSYSNSTVQRVHMMFDKFFIAKMNAINEAIHFYYKCILAVKNQIRGGENTDVNI